MSQNYRLPHLPNAIPLPPDEHALCKDNFALSKAMVDIAQRAGKVFFAFHEH